MSDKEIKLSHVSANKEDLQHAHDKMKKMKRIAAVLLELKLLKNVDFTLQDLNLNWPQVKYIKIPKDMFHTSVNWTHPERFNKIDKEVCAVQVYEKTLAMAM